MKKKYYYSCYGKDERNSEIESTLDLEALAEEIAEDHDTRCAEYPDEQTVWIEDETGKVYEFTVTADNVRSYRAYKENV